MSLAGAEHKLPLFHNGDKWFLPIGNSPSNCIVKPGKSIALNEFIVTRLAEECGFKVPRVELKYFEDKLAFISYRYDRTIEGGKLLRLHQEDMCQALSIPPEKKYETDGGPGIGDVVKLIELHSSFPLLDIREFYRILVFNYIVGNCDSHAKNYSFLYDREGRKRLSPFYDLVSTTIYSGISRELSMKIGKKKNIDIVLKDDFLSSDGVNGRAMEKVISDVVKAFNSSIIKMSEDGEYSPYKEMIEKIKDDSAPRIERLMS